MSNKVIKIISVLAMMFVILATVTPVFAAGIDIDINAFDSYTDSSGASGSATRIMGAIITIIQVVGTGVAILMLIVLAIKYISAAPGDKADIKKHAVVYVVGAVVLFAATGILQIIKQFSSNVNT